MKFKIGQRVKIVHDSINSYGDGDTQPNTKDLVGEFGVIKEIRYGDRYVIYLDNENKNAYWGDSGWLWRTRDLMLANLNKRL